MEISKIAGKPADPSLLINVPRLVTALNPKLKLGENETLKSTVDET